ncbi:MAG: C39 family peptidase [Myxococcaceae bacterium]
MVSRIHSRPAARADSRSSSAAPKEANTLAIRRSTDSFKPSVSNLAKPPQGTAIGLKPGETVKNPALFDYLQAHPEIKTVQNLVNATYKQGKFESTCRELGLNPTELAKTRSANLIDFAVNPAPTGPVVPAGPAPDDPAAPAAPAGPDGQIVLNPALASYLAEHPVIQTVQNLVNATWSKGTFYSTCESLGLDAKEVLNYRTAYLKDWAVVRQPPPGTIPRTVEEANAYHLTQYNTAPFGTDYNRYFTSGNDFSNNCGPAALAMAMKAQGKMPADLNSEQQIDYARALISGTSNKEVTINGNTYKLLDKDGDTVGYGEVVNGAKRAGLNAEHAYGWGALNDALAAGHPVVAAGTISETWKDQFPEGHYGSAGKVGHFIAVMGKTAEGNYIVSDPMFANGAVEMTPAQLKVFVGEKPDVTTVGG